MKINLFSKSFFVLDSEAYGVMICRKSREKKQLISIDILDILL